MLSYFSWVFWPKEYLLWSVYEVQVLCPVFIGLLIFLLIWSYLYVLVTSPLTDICIVNIFSQHVACHLIFLIISFDEQRFLILMKSSFSVFSLAVRIFCVLSRKSFPASRPQRYLPILINQDFIFWFCIWGCDPSHINCVCIVCSGSSGGSEQRLFSPQLYAVVPGPLVEKTVISPTEWLWHLLESQLTCESIPRLYSVPLIYLSVLRSVLFCFDYYNFPASFEVRWYVKKLFVLGPLIPYKF